MSDRCLICVNYQACVQAAEELCRTQDLPAFKLDTRKNCGNCFNNDHEICSAADGAEGVPTDLGGFGGPCIHWKPN